MNEATDLTTLKLDGLRQTWTARFGDAPPAFRSKDLLLRALLYREQAKRHGAMKPALKRRLHDLAGRFRQDDAFNPAPRRAPTVGSALVRDWGGQRHVVMVTANGYLYREVTYGSLSEVARAISGTRWSGPRFFGLIETKARA